MNKYNLRKNCVAFFQKDLEVIRGRLVFKTKELDWLETHEPVIVLISIHSLFHEEINGDLKMNALLTTIKQHVRGKVTVLFSDIAHLHTASLNNNENLEATFQECLNDAQTLSLRYFPYCENCHIVFWHSYISQDPAFSQFAKLLKTSYQTDPLFQELIDRDAESTYTAEREKRCPDRELFVKKAREDLFEQGAGLLVLAHKGYRFQFYPGSSYPSIDYVNQSFTAKESQLSWIDVFLAIEKKAVSKKFL